MADVRVCFPELVKYKHENESIALTQGTDFFKVHFRYVKWYYLFSVI